MKVVVNRCYGGFGLSIKGIRRYLELTGRECHFYDHYFETRENKKLTDIEAINTFAPNCYTKDFGEYFTPSEDDYEKYLFSSYEIKRDDPILIQVVEELREESFGKYSELEVVEIPDDVDWQIDEYDGSEWIAEVHRTW